MQHLWLFAFRRPLGADTAAVLEERLKALLVGWNAHGTPVGSRVTLRYGHFLFIEALNEASGCSIDWLHDGLESLFQSLELEPADAATIFYWQDNDSLGQLTFHDIPQAVHEGILNPDTIVFDPQAVHLGQLERWQAPLRNTWMARYLSSSAPIQG